MVLILTANTLPDYLRNGLKIVFVGTNPGLISANLGHYFARPQNPFWKMLYDSGLIQDVLSPKNDSKLLQYGYGLTDLVKRPTRSITDLLNDDYNIGIPNFKRNIERFSPRMVCFVGKDAFKKYFKRNRKVSYGLQSIKIHKSRVFVVPSMSGLARIDDEERLRYFKLLKDSLV